MDFVPVTLAGREYKLRYTADDVQDICRRLTVFQPVGGGKVTPTMLGTLLLNLDPDAFQYCFWAGLRHIAQYKNLDPPEVMKLIRAAISSGQQWTDFRRPIFKGLVACGLAEFAAIVTILEEEERQRAQDGALDVTATEEPDEEETNPGNGSTPGFPSPTRRLTPFSSAVASESST